MDWDDIRVFLVVAREGAIRRAARKLQLDHSTVSRRLTAFEESVGVALLERRERGCVMTAAGEELMAAALRVEEEVDGVGRRIQHRDTQPRGDLRVSAPGTAALGLIMPDVAEFSAAYPEINLELVLSYELANLSRREADVAIRITNTRPERLEAERIVDYAMAPYASKGYLATVDLKRHPEEARWIGWDEAAPYPGWMKDEVFPLVPVSCRFPDVMLQFEAAKCGMGIALLPCFLGDATPDLARAEPGTAEVVAGVWLVRHPDLRATVRVRAFVDFMAAALDRRRSLIEGHRAGRSS